MSERTLRRAPAGETAATPADVGGPGGAEGIEGVERRRLRALDAFRGFVLALMLWTPPIGDPDDFPLLRHAAWNGWTISDLVFPAFLVASGASLAFLVKPPVTPDIRRRLVRRTIALLLFGIFYNAYGTAGADITQMRFTGVLQLIGLSGAGAVLVVLATRRGETDRPWRIAGVAAALPAVYGTGLAVLGDRCAGQPRCSPYHGLEAAILGESHLYRGGAAGYDPEGLVVVVAAVALVLSGYLAGRYLRLHRPVAPRTAALLMGVGLALAVGGLLVDFIQPVNKRLHTPAFQLLATGAAVSGLGVFALVFDTPVRTWLSGAVEGTRTAVTHPFIVLGRNALVVYLSERILLVSAANTRIETAEGTSSLQDWILAHLVPVEGAGAALGYSTLLLLTVLAITYVMYAMKWRIAL